MANNDFVYIIVATYHKADDKKMIVSVYRSKTKAQDRALILQDGIDVDTVELSVEEYVVGD